jgi:rRNA maturation RNase YbeY
MDFPQWPGEGASSESGIFFHTEDIAFSLSARDDWKDWLFSVAAAEQQTIQEVHYIFCSDEYLRQINVEYLSHDYYTDIITFPYADPGTLYGDLYISVERVAENAAAHQVTQEQELRRVMVHGLLHLAGYGDKTPDEQAAMRQKEDEYLQIFTGL